MLGWWWGFGMVQVKSCLKIILVFYWQQCYLLTVFRTIVPVDNSNVAPTTIRRKSNLLYSYASCWSLWYITNKYACALRRKAIYLYGYLSYRSLWCIIQRRMSSGYIAPQKIFKISSILRIHMPIRFALSINTAGQRNRRLWERSPHPWRMPEVVAPRALDSSRTLKHYIP